MYNKKLFRHQVLEVLKQLLDILICILIAAILSWLMPGCAPRIIHETEYITTDTTIYRDSIIHVPMPYEVQTRYCPSIDTLRLHTSIAEATAWIDWNKEMLVGTISNRPTTLPQTVKIPTRTITRTITRTRTVTVEKEKPLTLWQSGTQWLGTLTILLLIGWIVLYIRSRFR
jgi:hypothetical protein